MRPDFTYEQLVAFICRIAQEPTVYPHNPQASTGNVSQQLRSLIEHTGQMENCVLRMSRLVEEARNMVRHSGATNGSITRAAKTNTLTVK